MFALPSSDVRTVDLLPGVQLQLAEVQSRDLIEARNTARGIYAASDDASGVTATSDAMWVMSLVLAKRAIRGWSGIGDAAGEPVEATPENIERAMTAPPFYDAFEAAVTAPAMVRVAEGNGLPPEPNGTSRTAADERTATAAA